MRNVAAALGGLPLATAATHPFADARMDSNVHSN
jgi:hypothetical protein